MHGGALEKLTVSEIVKKLPAFHETRSYVGLFITNSDTILTAVGVLEVRA
jgi:hypothetical protein